MTPPPPLPLLESEDASDGVVGLTVRGISSRLFIFILCFCFRLIVIPAQSQELVNNIDSDVLLSGIGRSFSSDNPLFVITVIHSANCRRKSIHGMTYRRASIRATTSTTIRALDFKK